MNQVFRRRRQPKALPQVLPKRCFGHADKRSKVFQNQVSAMRAQNYVRTLKMQCLRIHQSAVHIEQHRLQRLRKLGEVRFGHGFGSAPGVLAVLGLLILGSASCQRSTDALLRPEDPSSLSEIRLHLPEGLEHWRGILENDLRRTHVRFKEWAVRWSERTDNARLDLVLTTDVSAAGKLAKDLGLTGDARVPRTHPRHRIAVVPMARWDALLRERKRPPITVRQTVCHEAVHLFSLDRPELRSAPLWFQEGFAEHFAAELTPDAFWYPAYVPLAAQTVPGSSEQPSLLRLVEGLESGTLSFETGQLHSEYQLAVFRILAMACSREFPQHSQPWSRLVDLPEAESLLQGPAREIRTLGWEPPYLKGRDFDSADATQEYLLAAYPNDQVAIPLTEPILEPGSQIDLSFRIGRTGQPQGGFLMRSEYGDVIRVRLSKYGKICAYREFPGGSVPAFTNLKHVGLGDAIDIRLRFEKPARVRLNSGEWSETIELPDRGDTIGLRLEFYVQDGVLTFNLQ